MMWVFILVPPCLVIAGAVVVASFLKPHGDHAFAGRADRAVYTGTLMEDPDDEVWEQRASEMAAAPGRLDMLPPDPDPDPTLIQPHDVKYLGMTSEEYVNQLVEQAKSELPDVIA